MNIEDILDDIFRAMSDLNADSPSFEVYRVRGEIRKIVDHFRENGVRIAYDSGYNDGYDEAKDGCECD